MIRRIAVRAMFIALACTFSVSQTSSAQDAVNPQSTREARAVYTDTAPEIDGLLDEAMWSTIQPVDDFVQRLPDSGARPTERTEMRIAYDENNLYFGFNFFDKEPEKIRANIFDRGGRIDKDDRVWIMIDTFNDKRNAYLFEMNSLGTQDDAAFTDESLTISDFNWDAVFFSEGNIDSTGWTLEVAIPFRSVRFSRDEAPEMGLAVQRTINRKNETSIWPWISLDYRAGPFQVSQYATLTGLENLKRGRNIEIKPFIITGAQEYRTDEDGKATESDLLSDIGLDVKYGITSNLTLDLTLNTDFAQVESDNVQLNLTRFSLFFPEKREFFLERAGLFNFGDARENEIFFSRTIGIDNDILAGGRLTGQVGPMSLGAMNIQTEEAKELELPGANNTVIRVRGDVANRATIGGLFTNITRAGKYALPEDYNRVGGLDANVRFWQSSSISGWFSTVGSSDSSEVDQGGAAALKLQNDLYQFSAGYTNIGQNFRPGLGFIRRRDMIRYNGSVGYSPRFGGDGIVQQVAGTASYSYTEGQDHNKQSWIGSVKGQTTFTAGDRATATLARSFERLTSSFFIRENVEIVAGDYTSNRLNLQGNTNTSRRLWVMSSVGLGEFFGGTRTTIGGTVGYRFSRNLKVEAGGSYNIVDLPVENGEFDATTMSLKLEAATSKKLFATALIQYDNFSNNIQANIRIDWIHTPGSDLFLVFNTNYNYTGDDGKFDPRNGLLNDRAGVAKLTYLVLL